MSIFAGTELYREPKCDHCGKTKAECVCLPEPAAPHPPESQTAVIKLEKRKKGKQVTVVGGLAAGHPQPHFRKLLTQLKHHCGSGGSIKNDKIELQGDQTEKANRFLKQLGYRVG